METEIWALVPLENCILQSDCSKPNRAGFYNCEGCVGYGKKLASSDFIPAEVITDTNGKIHIVSVVQ